GRTEGQAMAAARAVVTVLVVRGIAVPDNVRERVHACTDLDTLDQWIRRATTATTAADVFDPGPRHDGPH
nr:hypothetical protein [Micromonospora sp. DSM 115978]